MAMANNINFNSLDASLIRYLNGFLPLSSFTALGSTNRLCNQLYHAEDEWQNRCNQQFPLVPKALAITWKRHFENCHNNTFTRERRDYRQGWAKSREVVWISAGWPITSFVSLNISNISSASIVGMIQHCLNINDSRAIVPGILLNVSYNVLRGRFMLASLNIISTSLCYFVSKSTNDSEDAMFRWLLLNTIATSFAETYHFLKPVVLKISNNVGQKTIIRNLCGSIWQNVKSVKYKLFG